MTNFQQNRLDFQLAAYIKGIREHDYDLLKNLVAPSFYQLNLEKENPEQTSSLSSLILDNEKLLRYPVWSILEESGTMAVVLLDYRILDQEDSSLVWKGVHELQVWKENSISRKWMLSMMERTVVPLLNESEGEKAGLDRIKDRISSLFKSAREENSDHPSLSDQMASMNVLVKNMPADHPDSMVLEMDKDLRKKFVLSQSVIDPFNQKDNEQALQVMMAPSSLMLADVQIGFLSDKENWNPRIGDPEGAALFLENRRSGRPPLLRWKAQFVPVQDVIEISLPVTYGLFTSSKENRLLSRLEQAAALNFKEKTILVTPDWHDGLEIPMKKGSLIMAAFAKQLVKDGNNRVILLASSKEMLKELTTALQVLEEPESKYVTD